MLKSRYTNRITKHFWNKLDIFQFKPQSVNYNDLAFEDIPEVSPALIKKKLRLNNLNFDEGFTCFIIPCKYCLEERKTSKIYINKATGLYVLCIIF